MSKKTLNIYKIYREFVVAILNMLNEIKLYLRTKLMDVFEIMC